MPISIPKFFQKAFAENGGKQDVPITGDNSDGRASYDLGFPPVTRIPIVAGGIPPFGTDFNGVLYDLSQAIQYVQSGVAFPFDQDFATAIGGYEVGAIVSDASNKSLLWINETASNTAFPAGWTQFSLKQSTTSVMGISKIATTAIAQALTNDTDMLTPKKLADVLGSGALSGNGFVSFPTVIAGVRRLIFIQWIHTTTLGAQGASSNWPVAFPNNCLFAGVFCQNGASAIPVSIGSKTTTAVTAYATTAGLNIGFIGIGY